MKNYTLKISASLLLICAFAFSNAQVANTAPAKTGVEALNEQQVNKVNDIVNRVVAAVSISDEQKTKLQASILEAMVKHNEAVMKAKKEDESRLPGLNKEFVIDITSRLKGILTPEQFNTVMSTKSSQ